MGEKGEKGGERGEGGEGGGGCGGGGGEWGGVGGGGGFGGGGGKEIYALSPSYFLISSLSPSVPRHSDRRCNWTAFSPSRCNSAGASSPPNG